MVAKLFEFAHQDTFCPLRLGLGEVRGAEAAFVVTPWYNNRAMKTRELVAHFTAVADAAPTPILLYNVPQVTGVTLGPDGVAKQAEEYS